MNIETLAIFVAIFIIINILFIKYGKKILNKFYFRTFFLFYLIVAVVVGIYLYRFGFFGHIDYVDGKLHQPERAKSIPKPVAPKFESQPSHKIWEDAKREHQDNLNNFSKP